MKKYIGIFVAIMTFGLMVSPAYADYTCGQGTVRAGESVKSPSECSQPKEDRDVTTTVSDVINVVIGVLGIVAVLVIIIGGIMYATSAGDAGKVNQAKNMIQYAIIGLVVSLLAWVIVNYVIANVKPS